MTTTNKAPETKESALAAYEKACDDYETICQNTEAYGKDPETDFDCNRAASEVFWCRMRYSKFLND